MSNVIHPSHYTDCSLECIDVMVLTFGVKSTYDFCKMNAFKYMWRYKNKNGEEDLEKAGNYLSMAKDLRPRLFPNADDGEQLFSMQDLLDKLRKGDNL